MVVAKGVPKSDAEVYVIHYHVGLLQDVSVYPVLVDGPYGGDVGLDKLREGDRLEVCSGTGQPTKEILTRTLILYTLYMRGFLTLVSCEETSFITQYLWVGGERFNNIVLP